MSICKQNGASFSMNKPIYSSKWHFTLHVMTRKKERFLGPQSAAKEPFPSPILRSALSATQFYQLPESNLSMRAVTSPIETV